MAKARAEGPTLFLNAGDTFQGTPWFTIFRSELAGELMNMLNPDAMVGTLVGTCNRTVFTDSLHLIVAGQS